MGRNHIFIIFFSLCREIIRFVYAILAIAIEDVEVRLSDSNLPLGKSIIWFELSSEKRELGKQTTNALYY